jgi:hypothetical protein
MRKLKVDLEDLVFAFEQASLEIQHYLDLETGQVVSISDEMRREREAIYEEIGDDAANPRAFAEALEHWGLPEWMKEAVQTADQVERGYGTRYLRVPQADSQEGYDDMEEFIGTVGSERLREKLEVAIQGRGAFRRFKDVLAGHPDERDRWFAFQAERGRRRVGEWLEAQGIEPRA